MDPPPHFFPRRGDPSGPAITAAVDLDSDVVELTVDGRWTPTLSLEVSGAIGRCLAQLPPALLLDLRFLEDPQGASAVSWIAAAHRAAGRLPPVSVVLCLPRTAHLADRLNGLLPAFPSPAQARTALRTGLPPADRIRTPLPCHVDTPALARTLVTSACEAWRLPQLAPAARVIVSELVINALETGTDVELIVARRLSGVHLAVYDREPQLPRPSDLAPIRPGEPLNTRGSGLRLVHTMATAWGAAPTADGKIVWACIRVPTGAQ